MSMYAVPIMESLDFMSRTPKSGGGQIETTSGEFKGKTGLPKIASHKHAYPYPQNCGKYPTCLLCREPGDCTWEDNNGR